MNFNEQIMQITVQRCAATVTWHPQPGGTQRVTAAGDTVEEALSKAWRAAIGVGYSRPKWWQYWRWSESECPLDSPNPTG